uniref:Chitin-binding type-2 domain-containing protein n=1 Tax=Stomoxys calcitrans TaxID=35570 RepID=A0A1I8P1L0_STOCA
MKSMLLLICIIATLGLQVPAAKLNHPLEPKKSVNAKQLVTTPVCEGKNGVMVAMPGSCSGFFFCVDGNAIASSCGVFYHFNAQLAMCDHPAKALCNEPGSEQTDVNEVVNDTIANETVAHDICLQAPNGYKFAKALSCTLFYECQDKQPIRRVCPPQKHFNVTAKQCQDVDKAQCMFSPIPLEVITSKPIPIRRPVKGQETALRNVREPVKAPFKLASLCSAFTSNRTVAHPWDCNKFIYCIRKQALIMDCPKGLHFSTKRMRCEWPAVSECKFLL